MPHVDGVDDDGVGYGVAGKSNSAAGVVGESKNRHGVHGQSDSGIGVYDHSNDDYALLVDSNSGLAAWLTWNVRVTGNLQKTAGSFKIDHPLDPANKYLYHSFVESPDMKNVYDGLVVLDEKGAAEIELPNWFAALNKDFRYQITAVGAPGPNLYIAEEINFSNNTNSTNYSDSCSSNSNNNSSHFKIAGGTSGMKVSWQVTGIRKDPWANAHRIKVEEDKPDRERGYYLHPDLYGQPAEKGISHLLFPEQELAAKKSKEDLQGSGKLNGRKIVTEIVSASPFYKAEQYHQKYYQKRGGGSCYI
jgi:hypothetical protein